MVALLKCFSFSEQYRKRLKQARKMLRSTQLHGFTPPRLPILSPNARHDVHPCNASAKVSDLVHSILFLFSPVRPSTGALKFQS